MLNSCTGSVQHSERPSCAQSKDVLNQEPRWTVSPGCISISHQHSLIKALNYFFGFYGRSDAMTANPELCLIAVPVCTALGQSGVSTRPFSPTLPVMDNLALFLMASEKVSWVAWKGNREDARCYDISLASTKRGTSNTKISIIRHLHFFSMCFLVKLFIRERKVQIQ